MSSALAYLDASATPARRARDLIARMTLREKVDQLLVSPLDAVPPGTAAGFLLVRGDGLETIAAGVRARQERLLSDARLRIPALPFAAAALPGQERFPPPLGLAASWNRELVQEVARASAVLARAVGVRLLQGPVLTVADDMAAADPGSSFGGDPLLAAELVAEHVRGVQDTRRVGCAAAGFGASATALDGTDAQIGERRLRSWVLPPARAAVLAGVAVVMPAATVNGAVPLHADSWLLRTVLREEWGFTGAVLGQEHAVAALRGHHRVVGSLDDALALALESGVDALCGGGGDGRAADRMVALVQRGALPEWLLDDAVAAVLLLKFRLGLFEDPYPADELRSHLVRDVDNRLLARTVTGSTVLLSDPRSLLPVGGRRCRVVPVPGPDLDPAGRSAEIARALRAELACAAPPSGQVRADELTIVVVTGRPAAATADVARLVAGGAQCVVLLCSTRLDGLGDIMSTLSAVLWCPAADAPTAGPLAALLTGSAAPAGRLPLPVEAGRTGAGAALPLGHGLSYTRFSYSNLRVAPSEPLAGEAVLVSCRVQNTGPRASREVVQVYVHDRAGSVVRPDRVLAGFTSLHLDPDEEREVRMVLPADRFALWNPGMRRVVEPGTFDVLVGRSAADLRLVAELVVQPRDEPPPLR